MKPKRTTHAVVSLAVLDVRPKPRHRCELGSQLLLGEVVRVLAVSPDRKWWRIENEADRYRGWVRTWGLVPASASRARRWERRATARVIRPYAEALASAGATALVSPLLLNSRLIPAWSRAGFRQVELPDGRRGWVPAKALRIGPGRPPDLMARVRSLLGIPYLWGGRTALGFDCSGFTQQVLFERGVRLPRDARDQFGVCRALRPGEVEEIGDLVFFGASKRVASHVGLSLGGGYFAHARGRVMIASLDPANKLCDRELVRQFLGVRRPRTGARKTPIRAGRRGESA